jgi:N-sulfoglucosamine sulfohydrolase
MRRQLREQILTSRDTGFIPEGMLNRLAGDRAPFEYARSDAYPLERILDAADLATARDPALLLELIAALDDPHPAIRYWAAVGCLVLQERAGPAKDKLDPLLKDDWAEVRVAAAEAMAWLGEATASLEVLADVLSTGNQFEILAAQNALEYLWRAGHISLEAAQRLLRGREFTEPAQRIPDYLLGLEADARQGFIFGPRFPPPLSAPSFGHGNWSSDGR